MTKKKSFIGLSPGLCGGSASGFRHLEGPVRARSSVLVSFKDFNLLVYDLKG